jgi:hypothetical protein
MRIAIVVSVLLLCAGGISFIFWKQELKYALPTPVPHNYKAVQIKETIILPDHINQSGSTYLHFFNPECPCSRFNIKHFNYLTKEFKCKVKIIAVIPENSDLSWAKKLVGPEIDLIEDKGNAYAKACGVYSTPQAVIIDEHKRLYYRGNYNKNRYCTQRATNYVEIALTALIKGDAPPAFDLLATQSYGCSLPSNEITF